ncbi:MAG: hypothetical protein QHH09_00800 [Microgenomates group bacterium]|nr:hypothetical protein [Microgenomates group bacterium]
MVLGPDKELRTGESLSTEEFNKRIGCGLDDFFGLVFSTKLLVTEPFGAIGRWFNDLNSGREPNNYFFYLPEAQAKPLITIWVKILSQAPKGWSGYSYLHNWFPRIKHLLKESGRPDLPPALSKFIKGKNIESRLLNGLKNWVPFFDLLFGKEGKKYKFGQINIIRLHSRVFVLWGPVIFSIDFKKQTVSFCIESPVALVNNYPFDRVKDDYVLLDEGVFNNPAALGQEVVKKRQENSPGQKYFEAFFDMTHLIAHRVISH